jgi:malonyl CoA-acyl carrier protein transacylase
VFETAIDVQENRSENMRTLLLFDGLGGNTKDLIPALRTLSAQPENRAFFESALSAIDDVLSYIGPDIRDEVLPTGLPLRQWLRSSGDIPPESLRNSIVAGVCVHVHQLCQLQPPSPWAQEVVAALGHSIGLQAAIVAGAGSRRRDSFLALAVNSVKLVAVSLVRGQQLTSGNVVSSELVDRYRARHDRAVEPGPMAALTGMPCHELHDVVRRHNADGRPAVTLGLVNSPSAAVLSGPTAALLDFYFSNEIVFTESRATWAFLSNSIPFHSSELEPAAGRVADDLDFIGPLPGPDQLRVPVYATDAPRDLAHSTDLVDEFLNQVLLRPIDWEIAAGHAVDDANVERVIDFGPGHGARRFTRECLRARSRSLVFESVQQFSRRTG